MTQLKYPVLMVHGMGFRDRKFIGYWGRIPKAIEREGCKVYFGNQDSVGSIEDNGRFLAEQIKKIAEKNGIEKFNVIAHSKGGLDMRYAISTLGIGDYVASLSTICTPHNGSKTVNKLVHVPDPLVRFVCHCCDWWLKVCGDDKPDTYRSIKAFSTDAAEKFNLENPDNKDIYYQSFAFTYTTLFSDVFLWFPHLVVKIIEGENDGLVTPHSAMWGNFRGIYNGATHRGISHCDEVDMRRLPLTRKKLQGITDITDFYTWLVKDLQQRGF